MIYKFESDSFSMYDSSLSLLNYSIRSNLDPDPKFLRRTCKQTLVIKPTRS